MLRSEMLNVSMLVCMPTCQLKVGLTTCPLERSKDHAAILPSLVLHREEAADLDLFVRDCEAVWMSCDVVESGMCGERII